MLFFEALSMTGFWLVSLVLVGIGWALWFMFVWAVESYTERRDQRWSERRYGTDRNQ